MYSKSRKEQKEEQWRKKDKDSNKEILKLGKKQGKSIANQRERGKNNHNTNRRGKRG